jgi:cell division protein FtsL
MDSVKRFTQAYTQTPWRKQVQVGGLILLSILFAVLFASISLNVNARASTYGREILLLQEEIENQTLINADLRSQLGVLTSPAVLEKRALEMGFKPVVRDEQTYVVVPGYIERYTISIAPPPQPMEKVILTLPPDFTESLVDWVRRRLVILTNPLTETTP